MSGIVAKLDGVTLSAPVWLIKPGPDLQAVTSADGGAAFGHLLIDDAAGTIRVKGWQYITLDVPACTDAPRLFTGYVGQRVYTRGTYKDGPGRYIICELYDLNIVLGDRLLTGGDTVRDAETDGDRIDWLLGSAYLTGLVQDLGLVNATGLTFDANNYHGSYPADVLRDLTTTYEQIFFVYWDQVAEAAGLFFDFADANTNVSTMRISNDMADVLGDVDGLTVYPFVDAEQTVDPINVHNVDRFVFSGGVVYLTKQSTADEFFTDNGLVSRGFQLELDKIGKPTTALTFAQRDLDAHDHEEITITCTVRLPADQVNLIDGGMLIPVKFTHMPDYGFDDFTNMRVQNRSVTQPLLWDKHSGDLDALFDVTLTLATTGKHSIGGGGGTGTVPREPPTIASVVQTGCGSNLGSDVNLVFDDPITAGHMLVAWVVSRGDSTVLGPPDGSWNQAGPYVVLDSSGNFPGSSPAAMFYKIADSTENGQTSLEFISANGSSRPKILGWELDGVGSPTDVVSRTFQTGAAGTFPALATNTHGIAIAGVSVGSDNPAPYFLNPHDSIYFEGGDGFFAEAVGADYVPVGSSTTFSQSFIVSGGTDAWAAVAAFFPSSAATGGEPPAHGMPEPNDTLTPDPDNSTTVFNTTSGSGFAGQSLRVWLNGSELEGEGVDFAESDNVAGEVTFTHAPPTGANLQIYYLGL